MRAILLFLEFGLPLLLSFGAGVAATLATQRYLLRRDADLRTRLTESSRSESLRDVSTKQLLDEIATREDLTNTKDP